MILEILWLRLAPLRGRRLNVRALCCVPFSPCNLCRIKKMPGEVGAQRELEAAHGRYRFRLGPRLQPFLPRHDVLMELVLQQGLRELERAALVEVRVVWPVHPGYGEDVNTFGVVVFPIRKAPQEIE